MYQINQTLNDINAIKLRILDKETDYQRQLDGVSRDIEDLNSNTNTFDTSNEGGYFKICKAINEKLRKHFRNARNARNTTLVNEVIHIHRYSADLLTLAKIDLYHGESLKMD